jgi:DNA-binding NarL/FixJ family response regulator
MDRDTLTPEMLVLGVRAARAGGQTTVATLPGSPPAIAEPRPPELSDREQEVLTLVADGLPTREIALQLCYSERTVKKVLGDVVMKLGARSRSQAIARAVRQGII